MSRAACERLVGRETHQRCLPLTKRARRASNTAYEGAPAAQLGDCVPVSVAKLATSQNSGGTHSPGTPQWNAWIEVPRLMVTRAATVDLGHLHRSPPVFPKPSQPPPERNR